MVDTSELSRDTDCLEAYIKKGVALGLFVYGRCLEKGVIMAGNDNDETKDEEKALLPIKWYSKVRVVIWRGGDFLHRLIRYKTCDERN